MNLDDEVERLLRLHPAVRAGVQPEYRQDHWQPQHAVPRRPAQYRLTDETVELQVAADLRRIDADLEQASKPLARRQQCIELGTGKVNNIAFEDGDLVVRVIFTSAGTGTISKAPA